VPAALALIIGFYPQISNIMKLLLVESEGFLRFLTFDPSGKNQQALQHSLDTLAVICTIWLAVLLISLLFKLVEYLIFELKV